MKRKVLVTVKQQEFYALSIKDLLVELTAFATEYDAEYSFVEPVYDTSYIRLVLCRMETDTEYSERIKEEKRKLKTQKNNSKQLKRMRDLEEIERLKTEYPDCFKI